MKIRQIQLHNYRSIDDQTISVGDYSLLIGANNSGKSNLIDSIRTFYDKDLKFDANRDFPKFPVSDAESWMELEFELTAEEATNIKADYLIGDRLCRVRKWFHPQDKAKLGIYGYEKGKLSDNLFYGWKNVGQGKLGEVVYIPAVSRLEDHTKFSGPSALRDLVNDILKPIIKSSRAFETLKAQFEGFGSAIKAEKTPDKRSLSGLEDVINEDLKHWGAVFNLDVTSPQEDDIVKTLIRHTVTDNQLGKPMEPGSFGHGFQRHLIFTLIRIAASYTAPEPEPKKKEFAPELELLLFEEPESFLHPPQQSVLDNSLRRLASQSDKQVLAATHSPLFVSCNADDISDLVRFSKLGVKTEINQVDRNRLKEIFQSNLEIEKIFAGTSKASEGVTKDPDIEAELEGVRYFLWLNPERCGLFFSDFVLIVEGPSEMVITNYFMKAGEISSPPRGCFAVESSGKYNIHRFMNLLGELSIRHAVLFDLDASKTGEDKVIHERLNKLILSSKNPSTVGIDSFPDDLESFLGIEPPKNNQWIAQRMFLAVKSGKIDTGRMKQLKEKLDGLLSKFPA